MVTGCEWCDGKVTIRLVNLPSPQGQAYLCRDCQAINRREMSPVQPIVPSLSTADNTVSA